MGKKILLTVVFVTGAVTLVIETLAIRILSPYYGNTIYTFSSVISVTLLALSLGYYIGGNWANRQHRITIFYGIITLSSVSIFFLRVLLITLLPLTGYELSYTWGPLIHSLILFFLPIFLLGTLSPFAIAILATYLPKSSAASIAGKVFFWSTLGSLAGILTSSYFLVPRLGIDSLIVLLGFILLFIGIFGFMTGNKKKITNKRIISILLITIPCLASLTITRSSPAIYTRDGVYEKITIYDSILNNRSIRILGLDRSIAGALYLDPEEVAIRAMKQVDLYKIFKPTISNVLVLGGGAYLIPKILLSKKDIKQVDVVEIEPSLFALSKKYFNLPEDNRLQNYIMDGRRFLYHTDKKYDVIYSDAYYSYFSVPIHFTTKEFFQLVRQRLKPNGILIVNLIDDLMPKKGSFIFSEMRTLQSIFPNGYIFTSSNSDKNIQNIIFLGLMTKEKIDFNDMRITKNDDALIRELPSKLLDQEKYKLKNYPVLTDDYNPVEYLIGKSLNNVNFQFKKTPIFSPPLP